MPLEEIDAFAKNGDKEPMTAVKRATGHIHEQPAFEHANQEGYDRDIRSNIIASSINRLDGNFPAAGIMDRTSGYYKPDGNVWGNVSDINTFRETATHRYSAMCRGFNTVLHQEVIYVIDSETPDEIIEIRNNVNYKNSDLLFDGSYQRHSINLDHVDDVPTGMACDGYFIFLATIRNNQGKVTCYSTTPMGGSPIWSMEFSQQFALRAQIICANTDYICCLWENRLDTYPGDYLPLQFVHKNGSGTYAGKGTLGTIAQPTTTWGGQALCSDGIDRVWFTVDNRIDVDLWVSQIAQASITTGAEPIGIIAPTRIGGSSGANAITSMVYDGRLLFAFSQGGYLLTWIRSSTSSSSNNLDAGLVVKSKNTDENMPPMVFDGKRRLWCLSEYDGDTGNNAIKVFFLSERI